MIMPADKGRITVVLDKSEYIGKCHVLLKDGKTYRKLKSDPTNKYRKELVEKLKELKDKNKISLDLYRKLYPTMDQPPRFYGLPKVHKAGYPLRPIVSSIGTISYGCAKYLAKVLSPLVGRTIHHVQNSEDFVKEIRGISLEEDEELRSYDVTALFTSVPVDKALDIIENRLKEDPTLKDRTSLLPSDIAELLGICLKCTYFIFQGEYYLQIHGAAMGSPVSPIVCNLYMEKFEMDAIRNARNPPRLWKRYVDDTFTILKKTESSAFSVYLNSMDDHIKWTTEGETVVDRQGSQERQLAFLDTLVVVKPDLTITTRVYRKDTHTDQYLNFGSNHPIEHKVSVVRTLMRRADILVSTEEDRKTEKEHVKSRLGMNGYPSWILNRQRGPSRAPATREQSEARQTTQRKYPVCLPYIRGLSERMRRDFRNYDIPVYFKPFNTLKQLLVHPKDKLDKGRTVAPVYSIRCNDCDASYIGETERSLKARFMEHKRPSSTTSEVSRHIHTEQPGHSISIEETSVLAVEPRWHERGIKEAINIRIHQPSLNKDGGRSNLSPVWTNILRRQYHHGPCTQGGGAQHQLAVNNTVNDTSTPPEVSQSE